MIPETSARRRPPRLPSRTASQSPTRPQRHRPSLGFRALPAPSRKREARNGRNELHDPPCSRRRMTRRCDADPLLPFESTPCSDRRSSLHLPQPRAAIHLDRCTRGLSDARRGESATAHTASETDRAPRASSSRASSSLVVPVVRTSSTRSTSEPSHRSGAHGLDR
jgi:hypothetical protein